ELRNHQQQNLQRIVGQNSFICLLSFDVYVKKLIIEKMIDEFAEEKAQKPQKSKKAEPEKDDVKA
ncbi:MAG: hypothetical protein ACI4R5_02765, partial [Acetatifactor sp.]